MTKIDMLLCDRKPVPNLQLSRISIKPASIRTCFSLSFWLLVSFSFVLASFLSCRLLFSSKSFPWNISLSLCFFPSIGLPRFLLSSLQTKSVINDKQMYHLASVEKMRIPIGFDDWYETRQRFFCLLTSRTSCLC